MTMPFRTIKEMLRAASGTGDAIADARRYCATRAITCAVRTAADDTLRDEIDAGYCLDRHNRSPSGSTRIEGIPETVRIEPFVTRATR